MPKVKCEWELCIYILVRKIFDPTYNVAGATMILGLSKNIDIPISYLIGVGTIQFSLVQS